MAHSATRRINPNFAGYTLFIFIVLYFTSHHAQKFGWGSWVFRFYLKDLLMAPILLTAAASAMALFGYKFIVEKIHVAIAVLYFTAVFEILLPAISTRYAFDILDMVFYALGGLFYYLYLRDIHYNVLNNKTPAERTENMIKKI